MIRKLLQARQNSNYDFHDNCLVEEPIGYDFGALQALTHSRTRSGRLEKRTLLAVAMPSTLFTKAPFTPGS